MKRQPSATSSSLVAAVRHEETHSAVQERLYGADSGSLTVFAATHMAMNGNSSIDVIGGNVNEIQCKSWTTIKRGRPWLANFPFWERAWSQALFQTQVPNTLEVKNTMYCLFHWSCILSWIFSPSVPKDAIEKNRSSKKGRQQLTEAQC